MLFPKVLLNLQIKLFSLPRFPFYKRVSYEYPLFKCLLEKLFQTFYYSLKNCFEKIEFQNTILYLFNPMQAYLQKGILFIK
jgi:hypothetical protein